MKNFLIGLLALGSISVFAAVDPNVGDITTVLLAPIDGLSIPASRKAVNLSNNRSKWIAKINTCYVNVSPSNENRVIESNTNLDGKLVSTDIFVVSTGEFGGNRALYNIRFEIENNPTIKFVNCVLPSGGLDRNGRLIMPSLKSFKSVAGQYFNYDFGLKQDDN